MPRARSRMGQAIRQDGSTFLTRTPRELVKLPPHNAARPRCLPTTAAPPQLLTGHPTRPNLPRSRRNGTHRDPRCDPPGTLDRAEPGRVCGSRFSRRGAAELALDGSGTHRPRSMLRQQGCGAAPPSSSRWG